MGVRWGAWGRKACVKGILHTSLEVVIVGVLDVLQLLPTFGRAAHLALPQLQWFGP